MRLCVQRHHSGRSHEPHLSFVGVPVAASAGRPHSGAGLCQPAAVLVPTACYFGVTPAGAGSIYNPGACAPGVNTAFTATTTAILTVEQCVEYCCTVADINLAFPSGLQSSWFFSSTRACACLPDTIAQTGQGRTPTINGGVTMYDAACGLSQQVGSPHTSTHDGNWATNQAPISVNGANFSFTFQYQAWPLGRARFISQTRGTYTSGAQLFSDEPTQLLIGAMVAGPSTGGIPISPASHTTNRLGISP